MDITDSKFQTAQAPIKHKLNLENTLHRWTMNFFTGFLGLFCTLFIVTGVKRVLAAQWVNTNGAIFESRVELYHAVDQHFTIGLIVLLLWSLGLFCSAYLAGRNFAKSNAMIMCLTGVCIAGWVTPHVWLNGGFIGTTSLIRALLVIPIVAWGVLLAREHSLAKLPPNTQSQRHANAG